MTDLIIGIIVVAIIVAASAYIIREKKRGAKCIGCPAGRSCCSGQCSGCTGCKTQKPKK